MNGKDALFVSRAATVTNDLVRIGRTTYDVTNVRGVYIEEGSRTVSLYGCLLFGFFLFMDILAITTPHIGLNIFTVPFGGWVAWVFTRSVLNFIKPRKFLVLFTSHGNSHAVSSRDICELSPLKHAIEMAISARGIHPL